MPRIAGVDERQALVRSGVGRLRCVSERIADVAKRMSDRGTLYVSWIYMHAQLSSSVFFKKKTHTMDRQFELHFF